MHENPQPLGQIGFGFRIPVQSDQNFQQVRIPGSLLKHHFLKVGFIRCEDFEDSAFQINRFQKGAGLKIFGCIDNNTRGRIRSRFKDEDIAANQIGEVRNLLPLGIAFV